VLPGVFAAPDAALTLCAKVLTCAVSGCSPREEADAWAASPYALPDRRVLLTG
jgi:hypothetical protein